MLRRLIEPFTILYDYRKVLIRTTWVDIKSKYAGSMIGISWSVIYPLIFLGTYSVIYLQVFKVKFPDFGTIDYILYMFAGLVPFLGLSETISTGCSSIISNSSLIKNTLFPIDLLGAKSTIVSHITAIVGLNLVLVFLFLYRGIGDQFFYFIPVLILQLMFAMGITWVISSITVFIRDLQSIIGILNFILMMISPIAYRESMVPSHLLKYLKLNPFYYFITSYQKILILNEVPSLYRWCIMSGLAFGAFILGYMFFKKVKGVIVDNV